MKPAEMLPKLSGLVAVMDALGATSFTDTEIHAFLGSRDRVIDLLNRRVEKMSGVNSSDVQIFTFGDTVAITFRTNGPPTIEHVHGFATLLRQFMVQSLDGGILFRGALSIGTFYADDATNTVMGQAVSDAASWYNVADWVGLLATPYATLRIRAMETVKRPLSSVMVDYTVPLKANDFRDLKAINWPKGFWVKDLRPVGLGEDARAKCLSLLARDGIPRGAESKQFNAIRFYDHCVELYQKERQKKPTR